MTVLEAESAVKMELLDVAPKPGATEASLVVSAENAAKALSAAAQERGEASAIGR